MDYLRRKHDDGQFEGDDFEPELDPGIVHRLGAYTRGAWGRNRSAEPTHPEDSELELEPTDGVGADAIASPAFSTEDDQTWAVDDGLAALPAAMAEAEPYEPGAGGLASGSYEPDPGEPADVVQDEHAVPGMWSAREDDGDPDAVELAHPLDVDWSGGKPEIPAADPIERDNDDLVVPGVWGESALAGDVPAGDLVEAEASNVPVEGADETDRLEYSFGDGPDAAMDTDFAEDSPTTDGAEPDGPVWHEAELTPTEVEEADELGVQAEPLGATGDADSTTPEEVVAEVPPDEVVELEELVGLEPSASRRRSFRRDRTNRPAKTREGSSSKHKGAKRLVGLKIGASQVAAAQVVNNGAPELVEVFREPLEAGVVVSGEIRDPEALGAALKRLFELHKLPKRGVRLGLANNRIGVRVFEIEGVGDEQQLDNAIRFRAEEVLPIPLDEAVLDYVVLEDEVREDGTPWKRILLVVAYREVVDRYLQACRSAGLEVVGIDLEAFALLRSVEAPMDRGLHAGALVAVAIGHDRSTIAVSTGRFCEFTRVLDWGGWSLNVAIARELDRAPSEVEGFKRQLSFSGTTEVEGLTPEQAAKAREAIQRSLAAFVRELVASLQFYQAQPGALGIGEVVLTGGTAHMDGLPEALGELVGVPIRVGDPFKRVKVGPKVSHEGPRGSLSVAIGLGIED